MADSFGGSLNMVLWILIIVGGGYYSYRCLFATKGFVDQYGFGESAVFMTRFAGTCVGASTLIALVLLFVGPQGAWAFVAFAWTQALLATYFGYTTVNSDWAEVEGVKATAEGYIAPIFFLVVNTILLEEKGENIQGKNSGLRSSRELTRATPSVVTSDVNSRKARKKGHGTTNEWYRDRFRAFSGRFLSRA